MVIIEHVLSTGKTVKDTYGRAVKQKHTPDKLLLIDRHGATVATFRNSDIVRVSTVARLQAGSH